MPDRYRAIPARVALLALLIVRIAAAQTATSVPLANPGFEAAFGSVNQAAGVTTITGQIGSGWLDSSSQFKATVQFAQETSNPHGGNSCQKITVVNPGTGQPNFYTSPDF